MPLSVLLMTLTTLMGDLAATFTERTTQSVYSIGLVSDCQLGLTKPFLLNHFPNLKKNFKL